MLCGYTALGATLQELPAYVAQRFGADAVISGTAVGIAFLATASTRPFAGLFADLGRARRVVVVGGVLGALGGVGHLWAPNVAVLMAARLVMGAGEAALFSGALPWVLGAVPANRRGRVAGWFGLSMWGGLSVGPALAALLDSWRGPTPVWLMVTGLPLLSAGLVFSAPRASLQPARRPAAAMTMRRIVPAGAAMTGAMLGLASYGYGTIAAVFVLYLRESGRTGQTVGLAVFAVSFLVTRGLGSQAVDRFGGGAVATCSLAAAALGLAMIAAAHTSAGALGGVSLAGIGVALMYPSALAMTLRRADPGRAGTAIGATTSFWDLGVMAAGPVSGLAAGTVGYPAAFWLAAATTAAALILVRGPLRARAVPDSRTSGSGDASGGMVGRPV